METTGLNPRRDHIVSYGAVPVRAGRVHPSEAIYGLVHTTRQMPPEVVSTHTIRTGDLLHAPALADCVTRLDTMLDGHLAVAHGAWIEREFLRRAYARHSLRFTSPVVDTAVLARRVLGLGDDRHAVALEYAAEKLHLPVHQPHHALGDALTTANLFLALAAELDHANDLTTAALLAAATWKG